MSPPLVLMCSPHTGGVSDALAENFAVGLAGAGFEAACIAVREHPVLPCTGCGSCAPAPHSCVLARQDDAEWLFARFLEAPLVVLASPIFFYALPAHFKAWIDRGQRFWAASAGGDDGHAGANPASPTAKPVLALLAAGRPRGKELFSGALRTLRWFLPLLGARLVGSRCFRGLDRVEDLHNRKDDLATLRAWGNQWGHWLGVMPGGSAPRRP